MRKLLVIMLVVLPAFAFCQEGGEVEFVVVKPAVKEREIFFIDKQFINEVRIDNKKRASGTEMSKGMADNSYFNLPVRSTTITFEPDGKCKFVIAKETVKKGAVVKTEVLANYDYHYVHSNDTVQIYSPIAEDSLALVYWGVIEKGIKSFEKLLLYNKEVADIENPYVVYMLLFKPE